MTEPATYGDPLPNVFSVDLEEWFNFEFGGFSAPFSTWGQLEWRAAAGTERLLAILEETNTSATFFVLGWLAERQPDLLRRVAEAGHEIGCHSYAHRAVTTLDRASFAEDLRRARGVLEDSCGQGVRSFRAPVFSITADMGWAFEVLVEEGFRFDSSLFPAWRPDGGASGVLPYPHPIRTAAGTLMEFPISVLEFGRLRIPLFGGGYFRLAPVQAVIAGAARLRARGRPVMFYIHPHDLDPGQPRVVSGRLSSFRRYHGIMQAEGKLRTLLGSVRFTRLDHACAVLDRAAA